MEDSTVATGVRLSMVRLNKLDSIAQALNISRNRAVSWLIDEAKVEQVPILSVGKNANSHTRVSEAKGVAVAAID